MKNKFHYIKNLNISSLSEKKPFNIDEIISNRKIIFPNFDYVVNLNNKELLSINDNLKSLYIINIFDNSCSENFHVKKISNKENIFCENIYLNKSNVLTNLDINNCKNLYIFSFSNSNDFVIHDYSIKNNENLNFYYFSTPKSKKQKIDFTFNLEKNSSLISEFLIYTKDDQLEDNYITFNHAGKDFSKINYLSLNSGRVNSQIESFIGKSSFGAETHQHVKHFLLNTKSISNSKPTLIIENPDVVASHGNSIGSFNKDDLFYLQQRGFSINEAESIIIQSMVKDFFNKTNFEKEFLKLWSIYD